ncbi:hypothetical protein J6590_072930, partial [Homalodisca vitripennis]
PTISRRKFDNLKVITYPGLFPALAGSGKDFRPSPATASLQTDLWRFSARGP